MSHPPAPPDPRRRELLIALGAGFEVGRSVACRLASRLDDWEACGWRGDAATAGALGVPAEALAAASSLWRRPGHREAIARSQDERAAAAGARIVTLDDPGYPPALRDLDLPPPALWIRGEDPPVLERSVAIVGSRRADAYAREAATLFGRELAAAGLAVVSGFALGVDAAAHRGALEGAPPTHRCATVAVLGTGLGVDYPHGHRRLAERVAGRGALLTELPTGLEPKAWHFPVRNRLIAALSALTLVVRAAPRSGSLITARLALDLGRDVLAVPGRIFEPRARGTNRLIADGAYPALEPRDVLDLLGLPSPRRGTDDPEGTSRESGGASDPPRPRTFRDRVVAALVPGNPTTPEELAAKLGAPLDRVLGALLELELEGRVRREPGPAYVRRA